MIDKDQFSKIKFSKSVFDIKQLPIDIGHEVAFSGRSNSGKSSMLNTLNKNSKIAKTSKTPGRTQSINVFDLSQYQDKRIMDLPGYGFAKVSKKTQKEWGALMAQYFNTRRSLRGIISIMDIRNPFKTSDLQMIEWANHEDVPIKIVLNKSDKLSNNKKANAINSAKKFLLESNLNGEIQTFSSKDFDGLDSLQRTVLAWLEI